MICGQGMAASCDPINDPTDSKNSGASSAKQVSSLSTVCVPYGPLVVAKLCVTARLRAPRLSTMWGHPAGTYTTSPGRCRIFTGRYFLGHDSIWVLGYTAENHSAAVMWGRMGWSFDGFSAIGSCTAPSPPALSAAWPLVTLDLASSTYAPCTSTKQPSSWRGVPAGNRHHLLRPRTRPTHAWVSRGSTCIAVPERWGAKRSHLD